MVKPNLKLDLRKFTYLTHRRGGRKPKWRLGYFKDNNKCNHEKMM